MDCAKCKVWRIEDPRTATVFCPKCGDVQRYQDVSTYETESKFNGHSRIIRSRFMYQRLSHFRMWLERLQGLDHIPDEIVKDVRDYVSCLPTRSVSSVRLRCILKELNYTSYTNSIASMRKRLFGEEPEHLTPTECLEAETLFHEIEKCFVNNIKGRHPRKNLLSYSFILSKILERMGIRERFKDLKELKHVDKKREALEVWEMVCEDLT